jgi:hypothetical protein
MTSSNSKVVHLNPHKNAADKPVYGRQSALLQDLQTRGRQRLMSLLYDMFDNTDDALFELADKADNNAMQNLFFESMREVRIKRRGIENSFGLAIEEAFRLVGDQRYGDAAREPVAFASSTADTLSMVPHEDMEEIVAVDSMVSKAMSLFPRALPQLTARIDKIASSTVNEQNNPFGPVVICRGFVSSCHNLDIDIKSKLVLFKLFDKFVISRMGALLDDCNQFLVSQGVLTQLTSQPLKPRKSTKGPGGSSKSATSASDKATTEQADEDDVFAGLQGLLSSTVADIPGPDGGGLLPAGQAQVLTRPLIMELLSQLQRQQSALPQIDPQIAEDSLTHTCVTSQLDAALQSRQPGQPHSLGKVDEDVINLVQMLFQFILDDRSLAPVMKANVAQLQIPFVKVAMQDKTFFSRGGHPARKLLNEIATSALGWLPAESGQEEPLLKKVEEIVARVINEYEDDIDIFQTLLADFLAFREVEARRASLVERRIVDAEGGRARSDEARAAVQQVVESKMAGRYLSDLVLKLLRNAWSNVLFLVYLKEGVDSKAWQQSLETIDELLWSVDATQPVERQAFLQRVPRLLKGLREGLNTISYPPQEMSTLFSELEAEHLRRLKGQVSPAADRKTATADASAETVQAEQVVAQASKVDEQAYQQVDALQMGTWIEYSARSESRFRCRLVAIIQPAGRYIFVNRAGKKIAEHTRDELALAFFQGDIVMLDDGQLFDRALESVIGNLREQKKPK